MFLILKNPYAKWTWSLPRGNAFARSRLYGLRTGKWILQILRSDLRQRWYIFRAAVRSFLGHIGTRHAIVWTAGSGQPRYFEQVLKNLPDDLERISYVQTCTENLMASYPWVDIVDLHIFLAGLTLGQEFSLRKEDIQFEKPIFRTS